ncbi:MAG TPA: hypothetical protein VI197_02025 [Polyangiaceae bacterium]
MTENISSLPKVSIGTIVDQRLKVEAALSDTLGEGAYLARDSTHDTKHVVLAVDDDDKATMEALRKVSHAHLVKIEAIEDVPGGALVVTEYVEGESLAERLERIGKKEVVDAVRYALRLADALSVAHQAGAYHGRVDPRAIAIEPPRRAGPVLLLGGRTDADSFYRSPDRGAQGPSEHDDAWAIGAILLKMLSGKDPPTDGFESEADLEKLGVSDAALRKALFHSLHTDPSQRNEGLRPLKRELARWFVDHAGEEPFATPVMSSSPPPLPPSMAPPSVAPRSVAPASVAPPTTSPSRAAPAAPKKNRLPVFAIGGLVFGLGAAWAASSLLGDPPAPIAPPAASSSAAATPSASAEAIDLGEVDIEGESDTQIAANSKLTACVNGYLPKNSLEKAPDMGWVCSIENPRQGADKLRATLVANAPGRQVSTAMKLFSKMGWYDMLAFSVARAGCCQEAPPLKLSDPSENCERLDTIAATIGRQVVDGQDFKENLAKFEAAAECETKAGAAAKFKRAEPGGGGEKEAFVEYTGALK